MPRPGPRRPFVIFRLDQDGIDRIDQRARDEGVVKGDGEPNRSEMLRYLVAYGEAEMPMGWRPSD